MSVLDEIAGYSAMRVWEDSKIYSLEELKKQCVELLAAKESTPQRNQEPDKTGTAPKTDVPSSFFSGFLKKAEDGLFGKASAANADLNRVSAVSGRAISGKVLTDEDRIIIKRNFRNAEPVDGLYLFGQALKKKIFSGQKEENESGIVYAGQKSKAGSVYDIKKASPKSGILSEDFPYLKMASEAKAGGAAGIACCTEPNWFMGADEVFSAVRAYSELPLLKEDFVVDQYQIYQAKTLGADAVLLIRALLDESTIAEFIGLCDSLKMDAVVEVHNEEEAKSAFAAGAKILRYGDMCEDEAAEYILK